MIVDEISHLSDQEPEEIIAQKFTTIPNECQELKVEDIEFPAYTTEFEPATVLQ